MGATEFSDWGIELNKSRHLNDTDFIIGYGDPTVLIRIPTNQWVDINTRGREENKTHFLRHYSAELIGSLHFSQ